MFRREKKTGRGGCGGRAKGNKKTEGRSKKFSMDRLNIGTMVR
jgi:hypothetical protein